MNWDKRNEALDILAKAQEECAPIIVRIGRARKGGIVNHSALEIVEAPAFAVEALTEAGFTLSVADGAVEVEWLQ